jgi:hypothetical protein
MGHNKYSEEPKDSDGKPGGFALPPVETVYNKEKCAMAPREGHDLLWNPQNDAHLGEEVHVDDREYFYEYIDRIKQIDQLLEAPIKSLIAYTERALEGQGRDPLKGVVRLPLYYPPWVASDKEFPRQTLSVTSATCCATLQRLWRRKRRFPGWEKDLERLDKALKKDQDSDRLLPDLLARAFLPVRSETGNENVYLKFLRETDLLGEGRPLLASEILWVLINAGEGVAYTGVGFLSVFAILWALRYSSDRFNAGVAIGAAPPTAYITARCLLPIHALTRACIRRADLLREMGGILDDMEQLMREDSKVQSREFPFKLDRLTTVIYDYSEFTLARQSFRACAQELEAWASAMSLESSPGESWDFLRKCLMEAIQGGGNTGKCVAGEAWNVMKGGEPSPGHSSGILRRIVKALEDRNENALKQLSVKMPRPTFATAEAREKFWNEQHNAAKEALELCDLAFRALKESSRGCARLKSPKLGAIKRSLRQLEIANRKVAEVIEKQIQDPIRWCEAMMYREIAHASAGNLTDLDPAELVSGLTLAVVVKRIDSPLRLTDAVKKALKGAREDGSWMPGQPFAIDERSGLSESAPTAGIVWMLSGAIARHRAVTVADEVLGHYVNWLDATKRSLELTSRSGSPQPPLKIAGWVSERMVRSDRIDLWSTAFVINSLLNIRGLMEFRLWQVCEQRFTILQGGRTFSDLEAADLGARQEYRLQRRLAQIARRAESEGYREADYAVVLHGPPGSSKTVIAQAVSREMWRTPRWLAGGDARLVRITPADFTRRGEERLDSEARIIFDILSHVRNVTILFDEIDDLLRERNPKEPPTFLKLVVPAMLNRLQDLRDACARQEIFFVLATNYIERIEPALIRKGRIDYAIPLVYPDRDSRLAVIERRIAKARKEIGDWAAGLLLSEIAQDSIDKTCCWPWMALDSMCKEAGAVMKVYGVAWQTAPKKSKKEVEQRARERLNEIVEQYEASLSRAKYVSRLEDYGSSAELREEFLHYMFAAAKDLDDYRSKVDEELVMLKIKGKVLARSIQLWKAQGRFEPAADLERKPA